ncbi:MAG TPA: patatin-like phospholipase family protein [Dokdonella sp.]|uniref:patatin-like phospholipase family protein n=1 Tax=Dokdonella sp. TaxID=2291710 RepID=UPI002D80AF14|nr:patatin-like phospholipase family protein [Dokdonella sp.]HET9032880.1 patatin-like phospholipase family protein [Dokdonella sp.]
MSPRQKSAAQTRRKGPAPVVESIARYQRIALVLQGGGALGAYQCGVYESLHGAGIRPDWFAGTSIGAINAAIIAGNAETDRIGRLREFWNQITGHGASMAWPLDVLAAAAAWMPPSKALTSALSASSALGSLTIGQRGFFEPRPLPPTLFADGSPQATSLYDTSALKHTLERLVDFDRINHGDVRLSVGAANVTSGNVRYFDSARETLRAEHIMASAALPPAFPAIEIDGELWWDGGIVSNTPLNHVLSGKPRLDSLVLQVDLWSAHGERPKTLMDVFERQKDIQYSSRTRYGTDVVAREQKLRNALGMLIENLPGKKLPPALELDLEPWLCDRVFNIVHLIYQAKHHEQQYKDYSFGTTSMHEHWSGGLADMQRTLEKPEFFALPSRDIGVVTHDIHRVLKSGKA